MRYSGAGLRVSATDLSNFVSCRYLTNLDLLHAKGLLKPPRMVDIGFEDIVARGERHERKVLEALRSAGHSVVEIPEDGRDSISATCQAVDSGEADVIYQGVLVRAGAYEDAELYGRPDFLVRAGLLTGPQGHASRVGGYEIVDAKLALSAKARAVCRPPSTRGSWPTYRDTRRNSCTSPSEAAPSSPSRSATSLLTNARPACFSESSSSKRLATRLLPSLIPSRSSTAPSVAGRRGARPSAGATTTSHSLRTWQHGSGER